MRNKIFLSFIFIFLFSLTTQAQNEKVNLPTFSFTIPLSMINQTTSSDVLAKIGFENSLYISVDDNMEKMLSPAKKNPMSASGMDMEEFAFDLKFKAIKGQYKGYDATEKITGSLHDIKYTSQIFTCKASKTQEAQLEYRVMEIGGMHYEFIITGKTDSQKKHQPMIESFWKSIVIK